MIATAASFGVQSMIAPLRRVLLEHVQTAYGDAAHVAASWQDLGYSACPNRLIEHGYTLLDVPDDEHATLACNVLALAPRRCMMVAGNPVTRRLLSEAGGTVLESEASEISLKGSGGPTCLTRPLLGA